jgi:4'-phosphopantetheinyl transferase
MEATVPDEGSEIAEPILAADLEGPWGTVRQSMAWHGHAVVYADWRSWLPGTSRSVPERDLRTMLGVRDWRRFTGLADPHARARFAATRLMLRHTVGAVLQSPPDRIELAYKPGGRPYLRGCDQLDVTLSHTRELIVVGINRRGRIGVDTEAADRRIRYTEVERLLCTPREREQLAELEESARDRELVRIWTLKEAYSKALGQGMRMGFNRFGFDRGGESLLTPDGRPAASGEWSFATFRLLDEYLVSVACHDAGLTGVADVAVDTMLDEGFLGAIVNLLRES